MRKIKCLDCDKEFSGETKEEIMAFMMPHYMEDHKDVMSSGTEEKKKKWFLSMNCTTQIPDRRKRTKALTLIPLLFGIHLKLESTFNDRSLGIHF